MKFLSVCAALSLLFLTYSCKKNCDDIEIGTVNLLEETKLLTPYGNGAQVVFENAQQEQLMLTNEVVNEEYPICIKDICDPIDPYKTKTCEFYSAQGIRNILRTEDDELLIELVGSTQIYDDPKDLLFYDFFSANLSGSGIYVRGENLVAMHTPINSPLINDKTILRTPFLFEENINLSGKNYRDVYRTEEGDHMLFLQLDKSLIALKIDGVFWVLVE